ncbi:MAG: hypothetical protein ACFFCI_02255 [Promethearchaeota archaeon]
MLFTSEREKKIDLLFGYYWGILKTNEPVPRNLSYIQKLDWILTVICFELKLLEE